MNDQPIKVLLVEDEAAYAEVVQATLMEDSASRFETSHVQRLGDALPRCATEPFDVVLLDLTLPDQQGLKTYTSLHAAAPHLPIVVLTGMDDGKLALQAVREGAQDYLIKGKLEGMILPRIIRYAIERKRAAEALRQSEEFFRLISENVTDLIAVLDLEGRRLYNSPSYRKLLGDPASLHGTDSFQEIHPEDRESVQEIFRDTLARGVGGRAEYRMVLRDGTIRHLESQGSAIRDETGRASKLVVVSRDITERKEALETLRHALSDLKQSHEDLKAAQLQLIQSEKLEAVSTFAAGVAHEVKNPLQTIVMGVDYLSNHVPPDNANAALVLADMGSAVQRADGIIRGLVEFAASRKREVKDEDLSDIVEQSLRAVGPELTNNPIRLVKSLADDLPPLKLDHRTIKHVFINLFLTGIRAVSSGGTITVRTRSCQLAEDYRPGSRTATLLKAGDTLVIADVEHALFEDPAAMYAPSAGNTAVAPAVRKESGSGLTVLKKIIELYGGMIEFTNNPVGTGQSIRMTFKAAKV